MNKQYIFNTDEDAKTVSKLLEDHISVFISFAGGNNSALLIFLCKECVKLGVPFNGKPHGLYVSVPGRGSFWFNHLKDFDPLNYVFGSYTASLQKAFDPQNMAEVLNLTLDDTIPLSSFLMKVAQNWRFKSEKNTQIEKGKRSETILQTQAGKYYLTRCGEKAFVGYLSSYSDKDKKIFIGELTWPTVAGFVPEGCQIRAGLVWDENGKFDRYLNYGPMGGDYLDLVSEAEI